MDDYVRNHDIAQLDLIELDVEEVELEALQGAKRTLERLRPNIICEILLNTPNKQDFFDFLKSLGYNAYLITNGGLVAEDFPLTLPKPDWPNRTQWKNHFFMAGTPSEIKSLSMACFGNFIGANRQSEFAPSEIERIS